MSTLRQHLMHLLEGPPMDIWSLSQALGIKEKETLEHLPHIARSAVAHGARLTVQPAVCRGCGFEFKDRRRLSPPGRCPHCKQNRIDGPWFQLTKSKSPNS